MPVRKGVKAVTNAGVLCWKKIFYERQPASICLECYVINHCKGACKEATVYLATAHENPYFFGKVNSVRKTITTMNSSVAPDSKKNQKKFVKSTKCVPSRTG